MGRVRRELCFLSSRVLGIILGLEEGEVYILFLFFIGDLAGWAKHQHLSLQFSSIQSLSHVQLFATP